MSTNSVLTKLNLKENNIGDVGAASFGEALKTNSVLTQLDLGGNKIQDIGAAAIGEALKFNTTLTDLILSHNNIGDVGATAIGEELKTNYVLTELNLRDNKIGDSGASVIGDALKINTTLTSIDLTENSEIKKVGSLAVFNVLNSSKSMKKIGPIILEDIIGKTGKATLSYSDKNLGDLEAYIIGEYLKINTTLTSIDLTNNSEIKKIGSVAIFNGLNSSKSMKKIGPIILDDIIGKTGKTSLNYYSKNLGDLEAYIIGEYLKVFEKRYLKKNWLENEDILNWQFFFKKIAVTFTVYFLWKYF